MVICNHVKAIFARERSKSDAKACRHLRISHLKYGSLGVAWTPPEAN
jgi:hypothetical protein